MQRSAFPSVMILTLLAASPALAHTGHGSTSGLLAGFGHPIGGLDHILAMVAVGILAAQQGEKSLWLLPTSFVAMMILGGVAGMLSLPLPFVELGIVGSIVLLGVAIAVGRHLPAAAAAAAVGILAVFHGHAHGSEMPAGMSGAEYGVGFALATAILHGVGIVFGLGAQKIATALAPIAIRASGAAIAFVGVGLLTA